MNKDTLAVSKAKLEQELATIEVELVDIGYLHPAKTDDWEARKQELTADAEDRNILADKFEETTTNDSISRELVVRHENIKRALERIEAGTYGTCTVCGKEVSPQRMEANPAADTCIDHAS